MRSPSRFSLAVLAVILSFLAGRSASAQPLQYNGGPVLENFTIYPLYYGTGWSPGAIATHHDYLVNLAAYMSSENNPAFEQPVMRQYGVLQVKIAAAVTASPTAPATTLSPTQVLNIIKNNQGPGGVLPAFGPNTLIALFPGSGFGVNGCSGCGGHHDSEANSHYWLVVPRDQPNDVIAHEIFEASADPSVNNSPGWDEAVDPCDSAADVILSFGHIAPPVDDTDAGACSNTAPVPGYTSLDEFQVYGYTLADYKTRYAALYPQGYRLYILQAYVQSDGGVRYNAVFRKAGNTPEKHEYALTFTQYKTEYDSIYPNGWRIYILDAYVLKNGDVRYNAVWRKGTLGEQQVYADTLSQYLSTYSSLKANWNLYILQTYLPAPTLNAVWHPGTVGEKQDIAVTLAQLKSDYSDLRKQGWRLYILQAYVLSNGNVRYNAVWHPGTHPEIEMYEANYTDYRAKYDTLYQEGWRLYILQTYVLNNGDVQYNAVWRKGTVDRPL